MTKGKSCVYILHYLTEKKTGDAASTMEWDVTVTLDTALLTFFGLNDARTCMPWKAPWMLIDEKRNATWVNLQQLISSEVPSGCMSLKN